MRRHIPGLNEQARGEGVVLEGVFLVQVERAFYKHHAQKPFFALRFKILEPRQHQGQILSGRLYSTEKALWKLSWFLRDFGYDAELLGRDELDEKALVGLAGVVKLSRTTVNGRTYLNLDAFAPASEWNEFMVVSPPRMPEPEVA